MYLGGNGLNCEVELLGDSMIVHNTKISSLYPAGMGGRESRFARRHESEANLLGVVFDPRGIMTGAPYRVIEGSHWTYSGTGLRTGDHFGEKSLHMRCPGGASGHETDKISPSSPKNVTLLAKGLNPDEGGADMVLLATRRHGRAASSRSARFAGRARCRWMRMCRRSRRMCCGGFWSRSSFSGSHVDAEAATARRRRGRLQLTSSAPTSPG